MVRLVPGGPFDDERTLAPEIEASLQAYYGLDLPLYKQYFQYISNLLQGDLGPSLKHPGWSVQELISQKLPISAELGLYALLIAVVFGITAGLIGMLYEGRLADRAITTFSLLGICLPNYVVGPLLILIFSVFLGWTHACGWVSFSDKILPAFTLAVYYIGYIARLTRSNLQQTLRHDYIRTATAKGLSRNKVLVKHALINSLSPIISYMGPAAAGIVCGSFVVETLFHIPGLGRFFITAAFNRDYSLVLGTVLYFAVLIILFNLLADILLSIINPRYKLS